MSGKKDDESLSKSDLNTILEVNKKTIEVQLEVYDQHEKIIDILEDNKKAEAEIKTELKEIKNKIDDNDRKLLKIEILLASVIISLVVQLIQMFIRK